GGLRGRIRGDDPVLLAVLLHGPGCLGDRWRRHVLRRRTGGLGSDVLHSHPAAAGEAEGRGSDPTQCRGLRPHRRPLTTCAHVLDRTHTWSVVTCEAEALGKIGRADVGTPDTCR